MDALDPVIVGRIGELLEPDESILHLSSWMNFDPGVDEVNGHKYLTVALTQERMYVVTLKNRLFGGAPDIKYHWHIQFSEFTKWGFDKIKDKHGTTVKYCFWFETDKGVPDDMFYARPPVAEPFMDLFKASIARFQAVQSAPDVAAQLTAMHALWAEGVLSDQEYQRSKELFLGKSPDAEQRAEKALRSLKQLLDAGVLSDSEFRSKKWQILSAS